MTTKMAVAKVCSLVIVAKILLKIQTTLANLATGPHPSGIQGLLHLATFKPHLLVRLLKTGFSSLLARRAGLTYLYVSIRSRLRPHTRALYPFSPRLIKKEIHVY